MAWWNQNQQIADLAIDQGFKMIADRLDMPASNERFFRLNRRPHLLDELVEFPFSEFSLDRPWPVQPRCRGCAQVAPVPRSSGVLDDQWTPPSPRRVLQLRLWPDAQP